MATEKKITKAEVINVIKEAMADNADVVAYCDNELALLSKKAEKAKARAAAKKEEGDALRGVIQEILENATEPMTREMVLGCIDDESGELTPAKIGSRISQLVQLGLASKTTVKTEDGKSKVAYTWGTADAE